MRWGIETSLRELKYAITLTSFHSKTGEFILQEIYARLVMYNFCQRVILSVAIAQDKNKKLSYQVNSIMGIYIFAETIFVVEVLMKRMLNEKYVNIFCQ